MRASHRTPARASTASRRAVRSARSAYESGSAATRAALSEAGHALQVAAPYVGHALLAAARFALRLLCATRGHHYVLKLQPRHLALHCTACGHTTRGWRLDEVEPFVAREAGPRYLELVRKRV